MALSQADFYAYSRATGAPVPQDPEEQARMAPDVLNFRRNQLKAPRQEEDQDFNLTDALGIGALAAGAAAGAYGLRKGLANRAASTPPKVTVVEPEVSARAQNAAKADDFGAVGTVVRSSTPAPSKPVPSPRDYLENTGALAERPSKPVATSPVRANQPGNFVDLTSIQENLLNQAASARNEAVDSGFQQYEARDVEERQRNVLDTPMPDTVPQEEASGESLRRLARDYEAGEDFVQNFRNNLAEAYEASALTAPVSAKSLYIESDELPANLARRQADKTYTTKGGQQRTRPARPLLNYQYTWEQAGIPEFERTARLNAYAATNREEFLDVNQINSRNLGPLGLGRYLGVKDPQYNEQGHLINGEFLHKEGDVLLGGLKSTVTEPEGGTSVGKVYDPVAQEMGVKPGSTTTYSSRIAGAPGYGDPANEAILTFRQDWDQMIREGEPLQPRYAVVEIGPEQLDMPIDFHQVAANQAFTAVPGGATLRSRLPAATIANLEAGNKTLVELPYQTRKEIAKSQMLLANTPMEGQQARALYNSFQATGKRLVPLWQQNVEPTLAIEPQRGRAASARSLIGNMDDIDESIQDFQTLIQEDFEAGYHGPGNISTGRRAGTTTADIPSQAKTSALYNLTYDLEALRNKEGGLNQFPTTSIKHPAGYRVPLQNVTDLNIEGVEPLGMTSLTQQADYITTQPFSVIEQRKETLPKRLASQQGPLEVLPSGKIKQLNVPRQNLLLRQTVQGPLQVLPSRAVGGKLSDLRAAGPNELPRQQIQDIIGQTESALIQQLGERPTTGELAGALNMNLAKHPNEGGLGLILPGLADKNVQYELLQQLRGYSGEQAQYGGVLGSTSFTGQAFPQKGSQKQRPTEGTRTVGLSYSEPYYSEGLDKYGNPEDFSYELQRGRTPSQPLVNREFAASEAARAGRTPEQIAQELIIASQKRPSDTPARPPASAMYPRAPRTSSDLTDVYKSPLYAQSQRASVESPGIIETFKTNVQDLSNAMGQLMAQAGRRAGKRRNR
jgi:hypothetical protein